LAVIYETAPLDMHKSELVLGGYTVFDIKLKPGILASLVDIMPIDLIVLALEMSGQEDFKLLSMLLESTDFNHIPVVVISGNCQPEVAHKVIVYGAREFLPRMVTSPRKLVDTLNEMLEQK
jgi:DNA-binding NarL/FixJ family response regulator